MIVITGQTATGKTSLALTMACKCDGELVNADSRQIYRGLDVITGKDLEQLRASGIPFHLFDIADPKKRFSSHEYVKAAAAVIDDIRRRGKTPIIVGGTYLYIKQLLYGFDVAVAPDEKLRKQLDGMLVTELQEMLSPRPEDINDSDWNNPRRLIRRIEIARSPHAVPVSGATYKTVTMIGLMHKNREALTLAIRQRVSKRIAQGAIDEVIGLIGRGYTDNDPGLETIGYRQLFSFIQGKITKEQAITEWTVRETQYAKRQYTFMKKDVNIVWRYV